MNEVKLFLGPQHPGMHGNYSVHMYVDGDIINKARPTPGFLHRGFEKLMERRPERLPSKGLRVCRWQMVEET